nr:MAG TPA: hypothetical protein [Caudoviricetes sp.]
MVALKYKDVLDEITKDTVQSIVRGDTMVPVCNVGPLLEIIEDLEMRLECHMTYQGSPVLDIEMESLKEVLLGIDSDDPTGSYNSVILKKSQVAELIENLKIFYADMED